MKRNLDYSMSIIIEPPFPSPKQNKVLLTIDLTPQVLEEALSDPKVDQLIVTKGHAFTLFIDRYYCFLSPSYF